MKEYAKSWENRIRQGLEEGHLSSADLSAHYIRIRWLQHERLVHLLVMLFVALLLMMTFLLMFFFPSFLLVLLFVILLVLTGFYVGHYYFLENTVQRWYVLADQMGDRLDPGEDRNPSEA